MYVDPDVACQHEYITVHFSINRQFAAGIMTEPPAEEPLEGLEAGQIMTLNRLPRPAMEHKNRKRENTE